jgi:hypothetical protein
MYEIMLSFEDQCISQNKNFRKSGVKGPLQSQVHMGLNKSSLSP